MAISKSYQSLTHPVSLTWVAAMLIIRDEQIEALSQYMQNRFEDRMVTHLNRYFHDACETLGEDLLRQTIRYGIIKAKMFSFHIENDVSRYLNLMFTFGRDFDTDPDLRWAAQILKNDDLISTHKMDVLYDEAAKRMPKSARTSL